MRYEVYFDTHLGAPAPVNGASEMQVLLVEALIAFILVFTVISTTTDKRVPVGTAAVAIGFALAAGVFLGGPVSGGAGNPARALGSMIVAGTFQVWPEFAVHRHTVKIAAISAASRNSTVR